MCGQDVPWKGFIAREKVEGAWSVANVPMIKSIAMAEKETMIMVGLDTRHYIKCIVPVSIGTMDASLVHPRECFVHAILVKAAAVIFVHNHPSGQLIPSQDDINITDKLVKSGEILGISVLDSLIVSSRGVSSIIYDNSRALSWEKEEIPGEV